MDKKILLNRLQVECVSREHCVGQINKKLAKHILKGGLSNIDAQWIIEELVKDKFVDDARFVDAYVRDKYNLQGWGRKKIEFNLKQLGVASAVIAEAITVNVNSGNNKVLENIILRKWNSLSKEENLYKRREKVIRFALSRGFDYAEIKEKLRLFSS